MIIQPQRDEKPVHEIHDPTKFDQVVGTRPGQRVVVMIEVAAEHPLKPGEPGTWWDAAPFWEGPATEYKQHIPSELVLTAVGLQEGAAFARPVVRAVI